MGATASNMKNGSKAKAKPASQGWQDNYQMVSIELSEEDKEQVAALYERSNEDPWDWLIELVSQGHKVSISPDERNQCVIATATGKSPSCANTGFVLSGRGPTIGGALAALWYKHNYLCAGEPWSKYSTSTPRLGASYG